MFRLWVQTHRMRTVATGVGLAALGIVAVLFAFACTTSSPRPSPVAFPSATATGAASPPMLGPLSPTTLPALSAQGLTLPPEMTLYAPRATDIASAVPQTSAVAAAQAFYPFVKLGEAQLLLMTDDQNRSPRLVWIVTVLDKPTFMGGSAGAPAPPPDPTLPTYWLVFVDAHTGKAMFGDSGQKIS